MTDATPPRRPRFRLGRQPRPYDPESLAAEQAERVNRREQQADAFMERFEQNAATQAASRTGNVRGGTHSAGRPAPSDPSKVRLPSLTASATRITEKNVTSSAFRRTTHETWQDDAWALFDLVGELRYVATTLAQRTAKGRLYIGRTNPVDASARPMPVNDPRLTAMLDSIGDGHLGLSQLIHRLVLNLFISGDGWLAGIPKDMIRSHDAAAGSIGDTDDEAQSLPPQFVDRSRPTKQPESGGDPDQAMLDDLEWKMLSVSEVQFQQGAKVKLRLGPADQESITCSPDDIYLIRVWRPHPRYWWQADSPVRSTLPVLRELVGLTMHIGAQTDSRLAGAGVFIVPESAARAVKAAAGIPEDSQQDPLVDALLEAMLTPISDRSNASAVVPLVITAPDDSTAMFKHLTFDKPFDAQSQQLREEAINRLALGLDAPPELLKGMSDSNHWGAWLVDEDVVETHVVPPLQLICDAITTQFLRPLMLANGWDESTTEEIMVWYDVDDLIVRPNRSSDAMNVHGAGALSARALREATGFDESDAPEEETDDPAVAAAFAMVQATPGLMLQPGLDVILEQLRALLDGKPLPSINTHQQNDQTVAGTPATGAAPAAGQPAAPQAAPAAAPDPDASKVAPGPGVINPGPNGGSQPGYYLPAGGMPQSGAGALPQPQSTAAADPPRAAQFSEDEIARAIQVLREAGPAQPPRSWADGSYEGAPVSPPVNVVASPTAAPPRGHPGVRGSLSQQLSAIDDLAERMETSGVVELDLTGVQE